MWPFKSQPQPPAESEAAIELSAVFAISRDDEVTIFTMDNGDEHLVCCTLKEHEQYITRFRKRLNR
jgi:hypothetical protein